MTTPFRYSPYIDFNNDRVILAPMDLLSQLAQPLTTQDKIRIFECRVDVWQLGPAVGMLKLIEANQPPSVWSHSAYGMSSMVCSYFEMIGKTLNPASAKSNTAGVDFNFGFCDVYPSHNPSGGTVDGGNPAIVKEFRDRLRNGMYHLAYTKKNLWIHNDTGDDFKVTTDTPPQYLVNPHQMIRTIVAHFPRFVDRIRKEPALTTKFEQFFDDFHQ